MRDAEQGGRALDAIVAERVMGWENVTMGTTGVPGGVEPGSTYRGLLPVPQYSTNIAIAWEVHRAMCDRLFSVRQRYYRALQEAVAQRMGSFVMAWPDVISFLEPVDFCRAALAAVEADAPHPTTEGARDE